MQKNQQNWIHHSWGKASGLYKMSERQKHCTTVFLCLQGCYLGRHPFSFWWQLFSGAAVPQRNCKKYAVWIQHCDDGPTIMNVIKCTYTLGLSPTQNCSSRIRFGCIIWIFDNSAFFVCLFFSSVRNFSYTGLYEYVFRVGLKFLCLICHLLCKNYRFSVWENKIARPPTVQV